VILGTRPVPSVNPRSSRTTSSALANDEVQKQIKKFAKDKPNFTAVRQLMGF